MPATKRPTAQDAATARRILLDGLAQDTEIFELVSELAPLHPRNNTFPGEVFVRLAADALDWAGASRADPVDLEGIRERFLPECRFRGREKGELQFAVLSAAALHGGAEPDLLDEVAWWQIDDFWQYALLAAVAYIRPGAPLRNRTVGLVLTITTAPRTERTGSTDDTGNRTGSTGHAGVSRAPCHASPGSVP